MQNLDLLKQIAAGVQKLLGSQCEVVIHDFSDLEQSIVHIEGNVTGRSIGGAATDLILSQVRQGNTKQDVYNYQTYLPSGRTMKSCTVFLHDDAETYGEFCINFDISAFSTFQQMLDEFMSTSDDQVSETLLDDIQSTIHIVLMETVTEMGGNLPIMGRDEKLSLIARLDQKGVFQVKKSVPILASELNLSRSTIYNYLSETRGERVNSRDEG
jgi:predicted transcriptional regulator YheO